MTMKINYWFNRNHLRSGLRFVTALLLVPSVLFISASSVATDPAQTYSGRLNGGQFFCAGTPIQTPIISGHWTMRHQSIYTGPGHPQRLLRRRTSSGLRLQCLDAGDLFRRHLLLLRIWRQRRGGARYQYVARDVLLARRSRRRLSPKYIRTIRSRIWA